MREGARSEREWTQIVRGEFLEIPGLRLTHDQIRRLWGLSSETCATVLETLLHQRFLQLSAEGYYVHGGRTVGPVHRASPCESLRREVTVYVR